MNHESNIGEKGQRKINIMSLRDLYFIIFILFCFACCAPKNKNSLRQPVDSNNSLEEFFKAIAFLDVEGVSNHLNSGFDANVRRGDKTALMLAVITPYFVPSKADKERVSSKPSVKINIVNERRKKIIQNLIERGADIDARDKHHKTVLMLAIAIIGKSYDYREDLLGIEIKVSDGPKFFDLISQYHNSDIWGNWNVRSCNSSNLSNSYKGRCSCKCCR